MLPHKNLKTYILVATPPSCIRLTPGRLVMFRGFQLYQEPPSQTQRGVNDHSKEKGALWLRLRMVYLGLYCHWCQLSTVTHVRVDSSCVCSNVTTLSDLPARNVSKRNGVTKKSESYRIHWKLSALIGKTLLKLPPHDR